MATRTAMFLGGARSGKSRLAQQTTEAFSGPLTYLATAEARDGEMAARIARHRADRGGRWTTIECPIDLPAAISAVKGEAMLVDCLTLWLSNLMERGHDVSARTDDLLAAIADTSAAVILVSNEVGLGIVPEYRLARAFRDEAGRLNQAVAAKMDATFFVAAGLTIRLQPYSCMSLIQTRQLP